MFDTPPGKHSKCHHSAENKTPAEPPLRRQAIRAKDLRSRFSRPASCFAGDSCRCNAVRRTRKSRRNSECARRTKSFPAVDPISEAGLAERDAPVELTKR